MVKLLDGDRRFRWIFGLLGVALVFALLNTRQPDYPATWFDEGLNTSAAATLARAGVYGLPEHDGTRVLDPAIQTGPTVIVPVALAFYFFGADLNIARLAMAPYVVFALLMFVLMARRLFGPLAGVLATLFLLVGTLEPLASFVVLGGQVLGEVPALGLFVAGLLLWSRAVERRERGAAAWLSVGLLWGLMAVTKSQIMLVLPVFLLAVFLADLLWFKCAGWRAFVLPMLAAGACVGVWYLVQLLIAGPEVFLANTVLLREGSALHVLGLQPVNWRRSAGVLWRTGYYIWGAPTLVWAIMTAYMQRSARGLQLFAVSAFVVVTGVWFVFLSIGWSRYAFYIFAVTSVLLAGLLRDLWGSPPVVDRRAMLRRAAAFGLAACYLAFNAAATVPDVLNSRSTGFAKMSDYLVTQLPADAVVETWEWEFGINAAPKMRHPPMRVTNWYTAKMMGLPVGDPVAYDPARPGACYLLLGPFGGWTGIYRPWTLSPAKPIFVSGAYSLYRLTHCDDAK